MSKYDDELERYVADHRDRFQIPTPAGVWWPSYEYPGYLTWYQDGEECPVHVAFNAGIGWNEDHVQEFDLRDLDADRSHASEDVDLSGRLTGNLDSDAQMVHDVAFEWLRDNARAISDLCSPRWVPTAKREAWGIPRRENVSELRERLKKV